MPRIRVTTEFVVEFMMRTQLRTAPTEWYSRGVKTAASQLKEFLVTMSRIQGDFIHLSDSHV